MVNPQIGQRGPAEHDRREQIIAAANEPFGKNLKLYPQRSAMTPASSGLPHLEKYFRYL
jgi:hypothetical protein